MDAIQELEIRQGELKEELAGLLDSDAENERVGVLTKELRALERQITARRVLGRLSLKPGALKASRRIRERLDLETRANIGRRVRAGNERRRTFRRDGWSCSRTGAPSHQ